MNCTKEFVSKTYMRFKDHLCNLILDVWFRLGLTFGNCHVKLPKSEETIWKLP